MYISYFVDTLEPLKESSVKKPVQITHDDEQLNTSNGRLCIIHTTKILINMENS